ncbi:MAG: hypothetical protein KGD63_12470 [Candidatus Lokiarchaeota archaeon]|nr:hypothetical protein [Candidatus Lokiarchaeota archaeon]
MGSNPTPCTSPLSSNIEPPSFKGVGFVIHRNELNGLLESYSFSKHLISRSPYGSMMMNYWISNLSSILNIEFFFFFFEYQISIIMMEWQKG